eukprot:2575915-Rhodomonas_salina.1
MVKAVTAPPALSRLFDSPRDASNKLGSIGGMNTVLTFVAANVSPKRLLSTTIAVLTASTASPP